MKKNIGVYIHDLSGNELNKLEDIIGKKYKQFRKFYRVISIYSENITSIDYQFSNETSLEIEILFKDTTTITDFISDVEFLDQDKYVIEILSCIDNTVNLTISK